MFSEIKNLQDIDCAMDKNLFKGKNKADENKIRGGYYTPVKLADFIVKWCIRSGGENILEPSIGDGNFLVSYLKFKNNGNFSDKISGVTAIEIISDEIEIAKKRVAIDTLDNTNFTWINDDFFSVFESLKANSKFDVILGNPPYIRFQNFSEIGKEKALASLVEAGYKPSRLTNAWVAFVELCIELLNENGRLAMVLPAELLQVQYAAELRSRLCKAFREITIIGFKRIVFPDIQQEVVILLADGKSTECSQSSDIHTIEFIDGDDLLSTSEYSKTIVHSHAKHSKNGMKWTSLFLSEDSYDALESASKSPQLSKLGYLASIDVGIVTGQNHYFVLTDDVVNKYGLAKYTIPIIGRTAALSAIYFTPDDLIQYKENYSSNLLNLSKIKSDDFSEQLNAYLKIGEENEIHLGYKCGIRKRWYDVPSVYIPDGFLFRQIHKYPMLVVNKAKVTSTDTIHRVRVKNGIDTQLLSGIFYNSLTMAWAEICGRSYGGGVLELEPTEAENLLIPYDSRINLDTEKVNSLQREGKSDLALDYVNKIVLADFLGFDFSLIERLKTAWQELSNRRNNRRN